MTVKVLSFVFILYRMFAGENGQFIPSMSSWKFRLSKITIYPTIVLFLSLTLAIWGGSINAKLISQLGISNVDVRPSLSVTFDIAKNTLTNRPLFGSGPNTFVLQWLSYKPDAITSSIFWNTDFTYGIGHKGTV